MALPVNARWADVEPLLEHLSMSRSELARRMMLSEASVRKGIQHNKPMKAASRAKAIEVLAAAVAENSAARDMAATLAAGREKH